MDAVAENAYEPRGQGVIHRDRSVGLVCRLQSDGAHRLGERGGVLIAGDQYRAGEAGL